MFPAISQLISCSPGTCVTLNLLFDIEIRVFFFMLDYKFPMLMMT